MRTLTIFLLVINFLDCFYLHVEIFYLKVIVGAHAVMANGGVIAPVGLNMVALAAQRHAVPFVVLAGAHKVFWHNNCSSFTITFRRKVMKPILLPASCFRKFDLPWV